MDTQNEHFSGPVESMIGRWIYSGPINYGHPETYRMGMDWLSTTDSVEDWGCGGGGAKPHCRVPYTGIDGSCGPVTDKIVDLREYTSRTPGLFMRHILEHNLDWRIVLNNALDSFTDKMALIMFLDWADKTEVVRTYPSGIVLIQFNRDDILDPITPFLVHEEKHKDETIFLLEK